MKNFYSLLIMLFLVVGTVITSFASTLEEGEANWVDIDSNNAFMAHGEKSINPANKSNGTGINIGFDIFYDNSNPLPSGQNAAAAYIQADGESLTLCHPGFSNIVQFCNFVFSYSIDGDLQLAIPNSATYAQWSGSCDQDGPLTLQDCFGVNSFGQIFKPSESGVLTEFTIDMTFLNESGGTIDNLQFYIYEIDVDNTKLGNLLQYVTVDLDGIPFQTDWTDYQFTAADFHSIIIPFTGIELTADNYYGVFPGGDYVPGQLPGEEDDPVAVPISDTALYLLFILLAGTLIFVSRKTILRF